MRATADNETPLEPDWPLPDKLLERLQEQQHQQLLEQALQQLPDHQRVPLVLFHFEEMSYQNIAQQLRVSLAKVKIDILRGRVRLAKQLSVLEPGDTQNIAARRAR
jgi:RNA polymerase sigma-70 factor, ECF subfamily